MYLPSGEAARWCGPSSSTGTSPTANEPNRAGLLESALTNASLSLRFTVTAKRAWCTKSGSGAPAAARGRARKDARQSGAARSAPVEVARREDPRFDGEARVPRAGSVRRGGSALAGVADRRPRRTHHLVRAAERGQGDRRVS